MSTKIGLIVAARCGSSRLPSKALLPFQGQTMLTYLLHRLKTVKNVQHILATTDLPPDKELGPIAANEGFEVFYGSENDVAGRFLSAAKQFGLDKIIRVTADCPFVNSQLITHCLDSLKEIEYDLATTKGQYPIGLDCEIFSVAALQAAYDKALLSQDHKEHVTLYFYDNKTQYAIHTLTPPQGISSDETFTIDTMQDYTKACQWLDILPNHFSLKELVDLANAKDDKYSKPLSDIQLESSHLNQINKEWLNQQQMLAQALNEFGQRKHCLLCQNSLTSNNTFLHRTVRYVMCDTCGHVQSEQQPTDDFPYYLNPDFLQFDKIYAKPSKDAYDSRVARVYAPKLNWALNTLSQHMPHEVLLQKSWCELGSGAGGFLAALKQHGVNNITGVEYNAKLIESAQTFLPDTSFIHHTENLAKALDIQADIYASFFVLEHVPDAFSFWQALANKPKGTIFIFAVPMFSFATLLESAFDFTAARNLDSALHTQLYTDESIKYALACAHFKPLGQWYFGQDSEDLSRLLLSRIQPHYDATVFDKAKKIINALLDPIQQTIDKQHFCDARHIVAIKE